ncbi:MAG: hypothetical protein KJZ64_09925 [Sphingomonadaceae bacterium]|nr:hypothetical protein [Sphingomonadaceae bacterium]
MDEGATAIHFWNFATCVVERDKWLVEKALAAPKNSELRRNLTSKLAKKNGSCVPRGFDLKLSAQIMRNAVAGAYVASEFGDRTELDFSAKPDLYPASKLAEQQSDKRRLDFGLHMFAECVIRRGFPQVVALLGSKPFSPEETASFDRLQPTMSACLPVSQGTRLKFTRLDLRARLGKVAYELATGTDAEDDAGSPNA